MPGNNSRESTAIDTGSASPDSQMTARNVSLQSPESGVDVPEDNQPTRESGWVRLRDQFLRKGKKKIGVKESLKAIVCSSCTLTIIGNRASD